MYKIEFKASVAKDIRKIPQVFLLKIEEVIQQLAQDPLPKNSKKIQGYEGYYRLRIGVYRIVYRIDKKIEIVTVIKINHRKEVYQRLFLVDEPVQA